MSWTVTGPPRVLLAVAVASFVAVNWLFFAWLFGSGASWRELASDRLAAPFMLDSLVAIAALAVYFACRPPGRVRWWWFVVLAFAGGVGFAVPAYWWLESRSRRA